MEKDIIEGNELIAEFMELRSFEDGRYGKLWTDPATKGSCFTLKYHSSWDWLIPVVSKILKVEKDEQLFEEAGLHITHLTIYGLSDINCVYKNVIEAVNWYNSNK